MEQVQRNFFMKSRAASVESGGKTFEVWPGYTFSINIYEAGLFLVSNVRAKVMPNYTVLDILNATFIECTNEINSGKKNRGKIIISLMTVVKYVYIIHSTRTAYIYGQNNLNSANFSHFQKNTLNPCEHIKKNSAKAPEPQLWLYFECCSQKA